MKDKLLDKNLNLNKLFLGMAGYAGTSILGPLVVFLILGFYLDKVFDTKPVFILISLVVAFVVTNILIFKKVKLLIKKIDEVSPDEKEKVDSKNKE